MPDLTMHEPACEGPSGPCTCTFVRRYAHEHAVRAKVAAELRAQLDGDDLPPICGWCHPTASQDHNRCTGTALDWLPDESGRWRRVEDPCECDCQKGKLW